MRSLFIVTFGRGKEISFFLSFLSGFHKLTLYSSIQPRIQFLPNFNCSFSGISSGCCFNHSSQNVQHFERNIFIGKRPLRVPLTFTNHSNIACLTSGALHFLPPPSCRNFFLEGSSLSKPPLSNLSWHLFANFTTLSRLESLCLASVRSLQKSLTAVARESFVLVSSVRVSLSYNHTLFVLVKLLPPHHISSYTFSPILRVPSFHLKKTFLSFNTYSTPLQNVCVFIKITSCCFCINKQLFQQH